jgi:hypothetical protein
MLFPPFSDQTRQRLDIGRELGGRRSQPDLGLDYTATEPVDLVS